jgi:hypothetical protein
VKVRIKNAKTPFGVTFVTFLIFGKAGRDAGKGHLPQILAFWRGSR